MKTSSKKSKTGELLVNKYEPKSFADLLSDDTMNRQVAQWLTSWNHVVFPEKVVWRFYLFTFYAAKIETG